MPIVSLEAYKLGSQDRKTKVVLTFNTTVEPWWVITYPDNHNESNLRLAHFDGMFLLDEKAMSVLAGKEGVDADTK